MFSFVSLFFVFKICLDKRKNKTKKFECSLKKEQLNKLPNLQ